VRASKRSVKRFSGCIERLGRIFAADVLPFNNLRDSAAAFVFNNIHKIPKRQPESSFCPFSFAEARKLVFQAAFNA